MIKYYYFLLLYLCLPLLLSAQVIDCDIDISTDTNYCFKRKLYKPDKIRLELKVRSEDSMYVNQGMLIADMDGDCIPEVIIGGFPNGIITYIINSQSGKLSNTIPISGSRDLPPPYAIADIDNDGMVEFFHVSSRSNRLACYNTDGSLKWMSNTRFRDLKFGSINNWDEGYPGLADFNQDGIPEVYVGNKIYNAQTGVLLASGERNGLGLHYGTSSSVAAQLDNDPSDLELAAGYTIYKVIINNTVDSVGNKMVAYNIMTNRKYREGDVSVADINQDGILDVIVNTEKEYNSGFGDPLLYVYTLSSGSVSLVAKVESSLNPNTGTDQIFNTNPTIGLIDLSGKPSIIISRIKKLLAYKYDGTTTLKLTWTLPTTDGSGYTDASLFDFNGDGIQEIIHRDETHLKIIDGSTNNPFVIDSIVCHAATQNEGPIIADVFNNGSAQICVTCMDYLHYLQGSQGGHGWGYVAIFGSPDSLEPWAPARRVWNQYAYNVLNINDDLTVPQYQKNNATYENGRYNNFMAQQSLLDSNGNYKVRAGSLDGIIYCLNYDPVTDMYIAIFDIYNRSSASLSIPSGMPVSFFNGDPQNGGILIGVYYTTADIPPGGSMTMLRYTFSVNKLTELHMVVNSDKTSFNPIDEEDFLNLECDYLDNFSQITDIPQVEMKADSICDGDSYDFGDTTLLTSGIYYRVLKKMSGCDSLYVSLELDVIDTLLFVSKQEVCDSFLWEGEVYKESGMYSHVNANLQGGCDTTIVLDLIVYHATKSTIVKTACDTYTWEGNTYTQSGIYSQVIANLQTGCDSTIIIELTINPSRESSITKTICDNYNWHGTTYDQSGKYQFDTLTQLGCDSVVILDLFIRDTIKVSEVINICAGDSVLVFGEYVKEEREYSQDFVSLQGCDSVQTYEVIVDPLFTREINQSICEGDSVFVVDRWIKTEGEYTIMKRNTDACDSLFDVQIILLQNSISYDTMSICDGDSVLIDGKWIKEVGDYPHVHADVRGCDSTANIHIAVFPPSSSSQTVTLCPGDSLFIDGRWIKETGVYPYVHTDLRGCDSIITTVVTIIDPPEGPTADLDCETLEIIASVELQNHWSAMWDNGDTTAQTTYTDQSTATLTLFAQPNCQQQFTIDLPSIPRLGGAGYSKDTVLAPGGRLIIDLGLDPNEWSVLWSPSELVDCDTCMRVIISPTEDVQITIYYRHISGCIFESSFFIRLINEGIYFPNVFTPNSDGINDGWIPFHTPNITLLKLEVYDRWGELVYKSSRSSDGQLSVLPWDGQFRKRPMSPSVFTYMAEYKNSKGEMIVKAGDLTLVR